MIQPLFAFPEPSAALAPRSDAYRSADPGPLMLRFDDREPCGGDSVIDLALCLILAVAIVTPLLLALP